MARSLLASITRKHIIPAMVRIPEGWFEMGSEAGQDNEKPVHRVWVDAFRIGETQVTNAEYACFVADTGQPPPPTWGEANFNHPDQPVASISWFEAVAYCDWLSQLIGQRLRLPTEAEWEKAARGGKPAALFPWGDESPESRPGYYARWKNGPERVRSGVPNPFGLFDVCENVHEWCRDWYQPDAYATAQERNPPGPAVGVRRSSRGGSWRHHIKISRCSARSSIPPEFQYADYGFRLAGEEN